MSTERQGVYIDTDDARWWLPVGAVYRFIEPPAVISRIPGLPEGLLGLAWLEGDAWPVVSLASEGAARAILVNDQQVRAILLVSRARIGDFDPSREAKVGTLPLILEKFVA